MSGVLRRFIGMARPGSEADVQPNVPAGYVDSATAAEILGLNARTARRAMTGAKVKSVRVRNQRSRYWLKKSVTRLLKRRGGRPVALKDIPAWLCPAVEAMQILGLSREGLAFLEGRRRLAGQKIKCVVRGVVRELSFYERAKVRGLARAREEEESRRKKTNEAIAALRIRELYESRRD